MPWRSSTSTNSTLRPPAASVSASAAATVDFPVPPLPLTKCSRAFVRREGQPTGLPPVAVVAMQVMVTNALRDPTKLVAHERTDHLGIRHSATADPCDQADPRPMGRRRVGVGGGAAGSDRRAARRLPQAAEMSVRERLAELGLELPAVAKPLAVYVPAVRTGNLVYTSGQLPLQGGELPQTGKVGAEVTLEEA